MTDSFSSFDLSKLPDQPDAIAPDGSEIRFLQSNDPGSSMVHTLLRPGSVTRAVHHLTVEESWVCVRGKGELWRSPGPTGQSSTEDVQSSVIELTPGISCDIPLGIRFQFRSTGDSPLEIVITTTPPWPGEDEAVAIPAAEGRWTPSL